LELKECWKESTLKENEERQSYGSRLPTKGRGRASPVPDTTKRKKRGSTKKQPRGPRDPVLRPRCAGWPFITEKPLFERKTHPPMRGSAVAKRNRLLTITQRDSQADLENFFLLKALIISSSSGKCNSQGRRAKNRKKKEKAQSPSHYSDFRWKDREAARGKEAGCLGTHRP